MQPSAMISQIAYRASSTKIIKSFDISLKTLLIFLSAMPKIVKGVRGKDIISSDIQLDNRLVIILRNLVNK